MGGKIQYHASYFERPVKSPRKRRQRVKAQKKRLVAAGMKPEAVAALNVQETRKALKSLRA